jgi:hypothetical protein
MGFLLINTIDRTLTVDSSCSMCGLQTGRKDVYGVKQMRACAAVGAVRLAARSLKMPQSATTSLSLS